MTAATPGGRRRRSDGPAGTAQVATARPPTAPLRIDRLTGPDAGTIVDPLLREYLRWTVGRFVAEHGLPARDRDEIVEHHHRLFDEEMPNLLGPRGRLLLATLGDEPAGVGALKPTDATTAEIKRMYVRPEARGAGAGRALLEHLVAGARAEGYRVARLETMPFMHEALTLYRSVGFVDAPMFATSEVALLGLQDATVYMELDLQP